MIPTQYRVHLKWLQVGETTGSGLQQCSEDLHALGPLASRLRYKNLADHMMFSSGLLVEYLAHP